MKHTYDIYEVSEAYKLSTSLIRGRARNLGFKPTLKNKHYSYNFTKEQVYELINYKKTPLNIEVIYVTQTFYIRESKMNFL